MQNPTAFCTGAQGWGDEHRWSVACFKRARRGLAFTNGRGCWWNSRQPPFSRAIRAFQKHCLAEDHKLNPKSSPAEQRSPTLSPPPKLLFHTDMGWGAMGRWSSPCSCRNLPINMAVSFHYSMENKGNKENKRKWGFANLCLCVFPYGHCRSGRGEFVSIIWCGYMSQGQWLNIYL